VFFTTRLFESSIAKAKSLMLRELQMVMAKTGILQTRDFIPPELYREYIDACFRLTWFGMYRETYLQLGRTTMTQGKLTAMLADVVVPLRFLELIESIITPVLIGKDVYIPDESLVTCTRYQPDLSNGLVWGTPISDIVGLCDRYCISVRLSIVDKIRAFPGAMTNIPSYEDVPIVSRVIKFFALSEEQKGDLLQPASSMPLEVDDFEFDHKGVVSTDAEDMKTERLIERFDMLAAEVYDPQDEDYYDFQWFVPFVYNGLDYADFGRSLAVYLPLHWYTAGNLDNRKHGADYGQNDVEIPKTYIPLRGNSNLDPRSYVSLSTVSDLRRNEGRLMPYEQSELINYDNILTKINQAWYDIEFPSLADPMFFVQPDWNVKYQFPMLTKNSLTRSTKFGGKQQRNKKNVQIIGNVHGPTSNGKIDKAEEKG